MQAFLRQVARHYLQDRSGMSQLCFVFPNRRSIAFFRKWMSEEVKESGSGAMIAPQMVTINDFFATASALQPADRVNQILTLYSCYKDIYPKAESLDEFVFWGDVILGDFNDIDKYLVDPKAIFTNISDFKSIRDDYSHLSDAQWKAIDSFVRGFRTKESRVEANLSSGKGTDVKEGFLEIWQILLPLYEKFNARLSESGVAYEGHIYRILAEKVRSGSVKDILSDRFPHSGHFVFVGLNALNECERTVLGKMRDAGIASFCWDCCGPMVMDKLNKSSLFMEDNLKRFPQAFKLDEDGVGTPVFNVVSVPSSVGQVKQVSDIVKGKDSDDCAVVLPDETLLMPLLNSLSESIEKVNVTMGYPLSSSELYAFMSDAARLQTHLRIKDGAARFWYKPVWDIFANGIFKKVTSDNEEVKNIVTEVKKAARYYVPQADLNGDPLMDLLFRPVVQDINRASADSVLAYASWQKSLLEEIGRRLAKHPEMALEVDLTKEYWCQVNRLAGIANTRGSEFEMLIQTYSKLLDSLLSAVSVPFNGEPLHGLQIMGPLETRALDFRNVVVLSCNEGVFPGRGSSSSFIPPELRRGFDLPTYEYRDAMWAYYFYRMVSRAENVWLLYDSRTEGIKSGEESRFIKQLKYHFHQPVNNYVATAELRTSESCEDVIEKTQEHVDLIRKERTLSPSSLQNYLDCPAKFYYHTVERLGNEEDVSENLDAGMIGDVYHNTMRAIYIDEAEMMLTGESFDKRASNNRTKGLEVITREYLESWLKRPREISSKILSLICQRLNAEEVSGRDLVTAEVIKEYVLKTLKREVEILAETGADGFHIEGVELKINALIDGFRFFGVMDRVDYLPGVGWRLVDYKTGKDKPAVLNVNDNSAQSVVDAIFHGTASKRHEFKAGLQFYIYDLMMDEYYRKRGTKGDNDGKGLKCTKGGNDGKICLDNVNNSMYQTSSLFKEKPATYKLNGLFADLMREELSELLARIADVNEPFARTDDTENCKNCDFKMICGR